MWAGDINKDCAETYQNNIGKHFVLSDIRDIPGHLIPDCDIVIGGFPCQGFSQANRNRKLDDNRNQLYLEFVRIVREKKPKFFVAENVRGLLSIGNGKAIHRIIHDFESIGYKVEYRVFNAADFGVPQSRVRVIIMGVRKDIDIPCPFPEPTHSKHGDLLLKKWVSVGEALKNIPDPEEPHNLKNHIYSKYKVTDRNFTGHRRTDPNKPSPTILAKDTGGNVATHHPNNHRRMSVRESAIIQSFPIDFEFKGSLGSMYRQIGNAVAVLFARRIAEEFKKIETLQVQIVCQAEQQNTRVTAT